MRVPILFCLMALLFNCSCELADKIGSIQNEKITYNEDCGSEDGQAMVTGVDVSGTMGDYRFSVTIISPDTGCNQYADWWEVITPDSTLIYRRILTHSHINEQPFTRSGGPIGVSDTLELIIRAHMNNLGYGCMIYSGTISKGFLPDTISNQYALGLTKEEPLPDGCAF